MKKIYLLTICLFLCLSLISCNYITIDNENNKMVSTELTGPNETSIQNPTAPTFMFFYSIEDIKEFISVSNGSKEQYNDYINKKISIDHVAYNEISHDTAKKMVFNLSNNLLPIPKNEENVEGFGIHYNVDSNMLYFGYRIDGVRYVFEYYFNISTPVNYKGTPAFSKVLLGSQYLELYNLSSCYVGCVNAGTTYVRINVYTDLDHVNFDCFDFVMIYNVIK